MVSLLKDGPRLGIYFICLDRTVRELPEECRTVAVLRGRAAQPRDHRAAPRRRGAPRPRRRRCGWTGWPARSHRSTTSPPRTSPRPCRREPAARRAPPARARRRQGRPRLGQGKGRTTRAVIGESTDGVFAIDIRADGPHGLVAGTTGSGKSELLQTMIASLAVGNRPDEFNFVLVDYKGGAAFKDCNHLPHTVGMVTDLDGHLTTRALESLGAELRRREHQLADADAKDIEDYLGRPATRRRADAAAADRDRRVRRPGRGAPRLRDRAGRRREAGSFPRRTPHPGDAATRRRGQRGDQVQHQPADRAAGHRRRRLRRRDRVLGGRADREGLPGSRLRPARALLADPLPELARRWSTGR